MANLQVQITMNMSTVQALSDNGSLLYGLKAVRSSSAAGRPLVWMTQPYSTNTTIGWTTATAAYTSFSPIQESVVVFPGFSAAIQTGQTLRVTAGGVGTIVTGGAPDQISLFNTTQTYFTCGLAQSSGSQASAPFCAFPLYGGNLQSFGPVEKILLMFSTDQLAPGTVIESTLSKAPAVVPSLFLAAISPGVLIDMTGAVNPVAVAFDINQGWSWATGVKAVRVAANANLVTLLIEPD